MTMTTNAINDSLKSFYTRHPYPRYPLVGRPIWENGIMTAPFYVRKVAHPEEDMPKQARVLVMGCGEVLPYVLSKWDQNSIFDFVDISQRSLSRAKWRIGIRKDRLKFHCSDIDSFLKAQPSYTYEHIDSIGVLHHLANPSDTLTQLVRVLKPGGTLRLMVYNSHARAWIRHFQKIFKLLGFSPFKKRDIEQSTILVRSTIGILGRRDWAFALKPIFKNPTRFADTFLNVREANLSMEWWMTRIAASGLEIISLLDRYGELDDLPNPAWQPPSLDQLKERALDKRFENNLELILKKPGTPSNLDDTVGKLPFKMNRHIVRHPLWFNFKETAGLSQRDRQFLMQGLISYLTDGTPTKDLVTRLPLEALQRLARLGAILPGMVDGKDHLAQLMAPMSGSMEIPHYDTFKAEQHLNLLKVFEQDLQKDPDKDKKLHLIAKHLERI
ncbi:MAG: class I SAM-dependent methyltransferase [Pseudomonadota bacterium]